MVSLRYIGLTLIAAILFSSAALAQTPVYGSGVQAGYPPAGVCVISELRQGPYVYFQVSDGFGRFLGMYPQYAQAYQVAADAEWRQSCRGIVIAGIQQQGYPNPQHPGQFGCQVRVGGNAQHQLFYRVIDRAGRIVYNTPVYGDALRVAQTDPRCFN